MLPARLRPRCALSHWKLSETVGVRDAPYTVRDIKEDESRDQLQSARKRPRVVMLTHRNLLATSPVEREFEI